MFKSKLYLDLIEYFRPLVGEREIIGLCLLTLKNVCKNASSEQMEEMVAKGLGDFYCE
jgi:hypothetical protein